MSKSLSPFGYYDILEACAQPGCPLCRLTDHYIGRYLTSLMHESVNDVETRDKLRPALGLCYRHTWQLPDAGAGARLGIAIIYRDLTNTVNKILADARYQQSSGLSFNKLTERFNRKQAAEATKAIVKDLSPQKDCLACVYQEDMNIVIATTLTNVLADNDARLLETLEASDGLCVPHLRRCLELTRSEVAFETLVNLTTKKLTTLLGELDEFIRKHDYRFKGESFESESDSWQRAIELIAGSDRTKGLK